MSIFNIFKKKDGVETKLYKNGNKSYEGFIENGNRVGVWTWWKENGQKLIEEEYNKEGMLIHLTTYEYWDNGQMKGKYNKKSDTVFDGISYKWNENGQKVIEQEYVDGKPIKNQAWWDNGNKMFEQVWIESVGWRGTSWNEDGSVVKK